METPVDPVSVQMQSLRHLSNAQRKQILGFGKEYSIENYCAVINVFCEFCFTDNRLELTQDGDSYLKA